MNAPVNESLAGETGAQMDAIYRYQRHIYDFTRKYYLLGRDSLIARLAPPEGGTVLEIGCGTGRNLICAAQAYPKARFFGVDISEQMLGTASLSVERAGLDRRISLGQGDATDFDAGKLFGTVRFDRIFLSYTLSMIPAWREVLMRTPDLLRARGQVHVVDFGQQERLPGAFRAALFAWLRRFDVEPRSELADALSAIAANQAMALDFDRLYRGYAWSARLRRRGSSHD